MRNFLKENWFKILIGLIIVGLFYWFEFRPTQIRENCIKEFGEIYKEVGEIGRAENAEVIFKICLWKNGLAE